MFDLAPTTSYRLGHDRPCQRCGHARHTFLACSDDCACVPADVADLVPAPLTRLGHDVA